MQNAARLWFHATGLSLLLALSFGLTGCSKTAAPPEASDAETGAAAKQAGDKNEKTTPSSGDNADGHEPASTSQSGRFEDRTVESGITFRMSYLPKEQGEKFKINLYDHGCGVVIGDYDGDGHDDLYFLNQLNRNALYKNKGDGTFVDVTEVAGVGVGDRICVAGTFADYDNDDDQDLFVTSTRGGNLLFENQGQGVFRDVTRQAGLELVAHSSTASFVDLDHDGDLDLIVTNTAQWTLAELESDGKYYPGVTSYDDLVVSPKEFNNIYRNNGDRTFTDITESSGLKGQGWGGDVAVFDCDADGLIDVLITNMFGASQLYKNLGGATFRDVTKEVLGRVSWGAIGAKVLDFNNDGKLDLFISDMHSDMWPPPQLPDVVEHAKKNASLKYQYVTGAGMKLIGKQAEVMESRFVDRLQVRYDDVLFGNSLFKAVQAGRMEEMSDRAGLETWWPWAIAVGDFDGDGYEDLFLASGMGYPFSYWHNHLMMNNRDETFSERSTALGVEPPRGGVFQRDQIGGERAARSSRCAAVADFDGDGQLEIVTNNFNDRPYYLRNKLTRRNYVAFKLKGNRSNHDAIGAVARLYVGGQVLTRQVNPAGGYLSQSSKTLHFGLGDHDHFDRVEIAWPSGVVQKLESLPVNATHSVVEPLESK